MGGYEDTSFEFQPVVRSRFREVRTYRSIWQPVIVGTISAIMLRLLGFDHTRLMYKFQGRSFRLTDVEGSVVERLLG